MCVLSCFSYVRLCATLRTIAYQAPLSVGFFKQEYWLPCPPSGDLPDAGMQSASLMSPTLAGGFFTTSATWVYLPYINCIIYITTWAIWKDTVLFSRISSLVSI